MSSSEELEWELIEIFEGGLFAFPIYDHASARKIVNYLLRRSVLLEEIADCIEDSTYDLSIWLNHGGKFMVGEWVIAWVNEVRQDYIQERLREGLELGEAFEGEFSPDGTLDGMSEDHTTDDGSHTDLKVASLETIDVQTQHNGGPRKVRDNGVLPPPLPPRTPQARRVGRSQSEDSDDEDMEQLSHDASVHQELSRDDSIHREQTQTAADDLSQDASLQSEELYYTTIPSERVTESNHVTSPTLTNGNHISRSGDTARVKLKVKPRFHFHGEGSSDSCTGLPDCRNCNCTLHYSYLERLKDSDTFSCCDLLLGEESTRAMEYEFQTLDREGPGYIYIMTDILHQGLSWSAVHRYKVASSRHPERCLMEFRSRNIEIELLWQVKVKRHLRAIKEVHTALTSQCIQSNWFRCSLHAIMEVVSRIARKYKYD